MTEDAVVRRHVVVRGTPEEAFAAFHERMGASEVEIRFIAEGADHTRVELEHRNLDRHGPGWPSLRDGVADEQGRPLYLARFAELLGTAA